MSERSMHDMVVEQCVDCAPAPEGLVKHVFVMAGGSVFHRSSGCKALREGQHYALRLGMENHPPRRVALAEARWEGRGACAYCFWDFQPA